MITLVDFDKPLTKEIARLYNCMFGGISAQIDNSILQWVVVGRLSNLPIAFRHVTSNVSIFASSWTQSWEPYRGMHNVWNIWYRQSQSMCPKWHLTIFTLLSEALKRSCIWFAEQFCPVTSPRWLSCLTNSITEPLNSTWATRTQDMESDRPKHISMLLDDDRCFTATLVHHGRLNGPSDLQR